VALERLRRMRPEQAVSLDEMVVLGKHGGTRESAGRPKAGQSRSAVPENPENQPCDTRLKYGTAGSALDRRMAHHGDDHQKRG